MITNTTISAELLTATVFASIISSIISIIIAIINNIHVKRIERSKYHDEINKYRYSRLYELILNWHSYGTPIESKGKTPGQIASDRLLNLFLDNRGRYIIARPLLDKQYLQKLDDLELECNELLIQLIHNEDASGHHTPEFSVIMDSYHKSSGVFDTLLRNTINEQLEELLLAVK